MFQREIKSIAKKRSDFEHKLNARGSRPSDYVRYVEYEMNLDSLRHRRTQRLQVKHHDYVSQRRMFFIFDRATRKFHGDMGLWMQYIGYARSQRSHNKVTDILTRLVRLHPALPALWVYAANYALEEWEDIAEARSYMQRGLRFCKNSGDMWTEFAKLEMMNLSKIFASDNRHSQDNLSKRYTTSNPDHVMHDGEAFQSVDLISLLNPEGQTVDPKSTILPVSSDPVQSGAIPKAIFDAAMKQFKGDTILALKLYDIVTQYDVPVRPHILSHILNHPLLTALDDPDILLRSVQLPLIGIATQSAEFPLLLRLALDEMDSVLKRLGPSQAETFSRVVTEWLSRSVDENSDVDVRKAVELTVKRLQNIF